MREPGLFRGEKNHTARGDSNGVRRRGMWAMPPQEPLDKPRAGGSSATGRPWVAYLEAQQSLHSFPARPSLWQPQLAQTKP